MDSRRAAEKRGRGPVLVFMLIVAFVVAFGLLWLLLPLRFL
jgi:hypothetical protein